MLFPRGSGVHCSLQSALQTDRVQLERFPAADDTDSVTSQTIRLMCRYIRESADDPVIQAAAAHAVRYFGGGSQDPSMRAWAVYWFVKHNVKFVVDEAPMFRLGQENNQDLLISPSVLIRMDKPQEDCDGFTMLGGALLKALNIPFVIVTIAADPNDPARWSHVFLMAILSGGPLNMDISHGSGPGWIVPAAHTFRWQAWDCDGNAVSVPRPRRHSLNGWIRTGMGQLPTDDSYDLTQLSGANLVAPSDVSLAGDNLFSTLESGASSLGTDIGAGFSWLTGAAAPIDTSGPLMTGGTPTAAQLAAAGSSNTQTSSSGPGFNWTAFTSGIANDATQVTKALITQSNINQSSAALSGLLSSLLPIVAIVLIGGFVLSELGSKK
jgi:hypothetical protein